ncbi:MAG: response regulator [Chloroflexi bacterium]|nr:response regulator [Chloroflexota bacterium]
MIDSSNQPVPGPSEEFIQQVKSGLEHLYDYAFLQGHPLAHRGSSDPEDPDRTAGKRLRRELIDAIEAVRPPDDAPAGVYDDRLFRLLDLRYIEGMKVQEVASALGISERQAYRDLRRGEECVAATMWPRYRPQQAPTLDTDSRASIQTEIDRLGSHPRPIDLRIPLQRACEAVTYLASQRGVDISVSVPSEPVTVSVDEMLARQMLTTVVSQAVQHCQSAWLDIRLRADPASTTVSVCDRSAWGSVGDTVITQIVDELGERLGWRVREHASLDRGRCIQVEVASDDKTLLVIDDNEGLAYLVERFLADQPCRVLPAANGQVGLRMARESIPDAIILDVMMPEMDGWEILQRLRATPGLDSLPIIVCSVIDDPELARSLGASGFLPKPIDRDDILAALRASDVIE